jgi:hypothetical protein
MGLPLTIVAKADQGARCGIGAVWHEYTAFVVSVQTLQIGLAAVVWLLLVGATGQE